MRNVPIPVLTCDQFRDAYHRFDGTTNVIHWKDVETPQYAAYVEHMETCLSCGDWFKYQQVLSRKINPADYPCIHMAFYATDVCEIHQDPWECQSCAVVFIEQYDEYGIPIRDGSNTYWKIENCPWCGTRLPESKRELWYRTLLGMGIDPFDPQAKIPPAFQSKRWFQER